MTSLHRTRSDSSFDSHTTSFHEDIEKIQKEFKAKYDTPVNEEINSADFKVQEKEEIFEVKNPFVPEGFTPQQLLEYEAALEAVTETPENLNDVPAPVEIPFDNSVTETQFEFDPILNESKGEDPEEHPDEYFDPIPKLDESLECSVTNSPNLRSASPAITISDSAEKIESAAYESIYPNLKEPSKVEEIVNLAITPPDEDTNIHLPLIQESSSENLLAEEQLDSQNVESEIEYEQNESALSEKEESEIFSNVEQVEEGYIDETEIQESDFELKIDIEEASCDEIETSETKDFKNKFKGFMNWKIKTTEWPLFPWIIVLLLIELTALLMRFLGTNSTERFLSVANILDWIAIVLASLYVSHLLVYSFSYGIKKAFYFSQFYYYFNVLAGSLTVLVWVIIQCCFWFFIWHSWIENEFLLDKANKFFTSLLVISAFKVAASIIVKKALGKLIS